MMKRTVVLVAVMSIIVLGSYKYVGASTCTEADSIVKGAWIWCGLCCDPNGGWDCEFRTLISPIPMKFSDVGLPCLVCPTGGTDGQCELPIVGPITVFCAYGPDAFCNFVHTGVVINNSTGLYCNSGSGVILSTKCNPSHTCGGNMCLL